MKFIAVEQHDGSAKGVQGPSETLNPLHIRPDTSQIGKSQ